MIKIVKNMRPYWKMVLIIFVFLVVQAFCDLALPQYTSDIIDVGIQKKGVEHILPQRINEDEYDMATLFMTDTEKEAWISSYKKGDTYYKCTVTSEKKLDKLDQELLLPIVMSYQMANMKEDSFRTTIREALATKEGMEQMANQIDTMSIDEIGSMLQVDLYTFEAENEEGVVSTYVDMRPMMQTMLHSGMMDDSSLQQSRDYMTEMISVIGSSTLRSMGVRYAISCDEEAGINTNKIQNRFFWNIGLKMLGITLVMVAASIIVGYFASKVGAGVGRDLRNKVFTRVISYSNTEMDKFSTASLITRSTNDIQQIQMVSGMILRMVAYAPIMGIGGIIKVIQTGANMGWVIGLAVLVIFSFVMTLVIIAMPKFKIMQKMIDRVNLVSREILTGLPVIRAFGRENREKERFDVANNDLTRTQLFTNRVMTFMMPGMMMIMYGVTVLIIWVAAHKINDGTLQVGAMTAFISYAMQIIFSFLMLTMMSIMLPRAGVAAERIDEVLRTKTSILDAKEPKHWDNNSAKGVLSFHNVNFRYPGAQEDALENIDFTALPGQTTAIIGSTGCGKSTLVNLIPRFYDVTSGSVTIDDIDVRDAMTSELRDQIGFVPQKGVLFSGTIASNIRFGNPEATDEEVTMAAQIAQAVEFIDDKPEKYDSAISQGGANVSGGQKQRLAIARAIAKNPRIFVFDDSFSALDMKTDKQLRNDLKEKVKDSTVIIVAQRISTILHADQILVLDEGKIVGRGTHEELLHSCDTYLQIAKSQLTAKELGLPDETNGEVRA